MVPIEPDITYKQARGYEQFYIEFFGTKTGIIGEDISLENRGNKINSYVHTRTDARAKEFEKTYDNATTVFRGCKK